MAAKKIALLSIGKTQSASSTPWVSVVIRKYLSSANVLANSIGNADTYLLVEGEPVHPDNETAFLQTVVAGKQVIRLASDELKPEDRMYDWCSRNGRTFTSLDDFVKHIKALKPLPKKTK